MSAQTTHQIDYAAFESKVYASYARDGLAEFVLGWALIFGGLTLTFRFEQPYVVPWEGFMLLPILAAIWRKKITFPRLGYMKLLDRRGQIWRFRGLAAFSIAPLIVAIAALLYELHGGAPDKTNIFSLPEFKLYMGAVLAAIIVTAAAVLKIRHLYFFAALLYAFIWLAYALGQSGGYAMDACGALLLIVSLVRVILFVRANPKLEGEAHDNV